ncbi:MAG: 5-deoxy-glucuronate isomerase [Acidobacteria bacterium]|nr:5-deoxy-glucuronate isomerase [Acidobacteriota bacterium]
MLDAMQPSSVLPGMLFRAAAPGAVFRQRFLHSEVGLEFLDCGEHHLPPGARTQTVVLPDRERLLFVWKGVAGAELPSGRFELEHYDVLYVPRGCAFQLENPGPEPACVIQCTAPAENLHPVFHARFAEMSRREERIRRLKGKDVYLMFDVGEPADKLVAGYTFFRPHQRSWPPHNHTDQEEVYFFLKGRGSMEVYESPETLSFVHNVEEGDLVTIPVLNYHPVFSQEAPLEFLWCIAGARYWVGDKHQSFMSGTGTSLTT